MMSFGSKLRLLRKSKKVSLRDLSKKLHYDRSYLSRVENNAVNPSDELIKAAAKFFRVREEGFRIAAGKFPKDILDILSSHPEESVSLLRDCLGENSSMAGLYCCGRPVEISNDKIDRNFAITFQAACGWCKTSFDMAVKPRPGSQGWWLFRAITLGQFEHAVKA